MSISRMRRRLVQALPLSAGLAFLPACGTPPLRLGVHPWIGYESFFLARSMGALPSQIQLTETRSASESIAAIQSGAVDAACLTLDEVLHVRGSGTPLSIIAVLDMSAGADVVMARSTITAWSDIAGKRIALEASAVGELMLVKLLEVANVARSEVTLVDLPPEKLQDAWAAQEIDLAITYEPTASRLATLGAERLFDSRRLPETIFDVLAVRADQRDRLHPTLRALLRAHFAGIGHLRVNRPDALHRIASRQQISLESAQKALGGVVIPDLERNRILLQPGSSLQRAAAALSELMSGRAMLARPDALEDLLDGRYLPEQGGA